MRREQVKSCALLFLAAAIWGTAFVAQSVGMDYVGPFTFNSVRSLIGSLALMPCVFLFCRGEKGGKKAGNPGQEKKDLLAGGLWCGTILFAASNFQQIGIQYTSVGKAGFITACYIVLVPILGIFLGKRTRLAVWASVFLAVFGLYLLCMTESLRFAKGDLFILCCAFLFACHILAVDHFAQRVDGVKLSCIQFLICALLSAVPMFLLEHPSLETLLQAWAPILYAGVFSCGAGYTLQIMGQRNMNPTVASLILSLESCISVLSGWIVLGQRMTMRELGGCAVMFGAILTAQLPQRTDPDGQIAEPSQR